MEKILKFTLEAIEHPANNLEVFQTFIQKNLSERKN